MLTFVEQNGTANLRGVVLVDGFLDVSDPQMQKAREGMHLSRCATGTADKPAKQGSSRWSKESVVGLKESIQVSIAA